MKVSLVLLSTSLLFACSPSKPVKINPQEMVKVDLALSTSIDDFKVLIGDNWTGNLSYLNYGRDNRSTIPASLKISIKDEQTLNYAVIYPAESESNDTSTLKITDSGRKLDGQLIIDRIVREDGEIVIVAQSRGNDDNRDADVRTTYTISSNEFRMKKDVKFDDKNSFINRNEYVFTRQ